MHTAAATFSSGPHQAPGSSHSNTPSSLSTANSLSLEREWLHPIPSPSTTSWKSSTAPVHLRLPHASNNKATVKTTKILSATQYLPELFMFQHMYFCPFYLLELSHNRRETGPWMTLVTCFQLQLLWTCRKYTYHSKGKGNKQKLTWHNNIHCTIPITFSDVGLLKTAHTEGLLQPTRIHKTRRVTMTK